MTLGEQIAQIRKQKGLTQAILAQMAGVSTSAIAMYETNRRQPDTMTVHALASALKVRTDFLGISEELASSAPDTPSTPTVSNMPSPPERTTRPERTPHSTPTHSPSVIEPQDENEPADKVNSGRTNLSLARDEARFILFMRMHPDSKAFLQSYMNADDQKRKQVEKAMRLIQAFQT